MTTPDAFAAVLAELSAEHGRAVAVHGFDEAHDDRHSDADWSWRLLRRVTEVMAPETVMRTTPAERRRALLECAHIAASAVASHDRRALGGAHEVALAALGPMTEIEPDQAFTSTDASWRYVARPHGDGIERHALACTHWPEDPTRDVCPGEGGCWQVTITHPAQLDEEPPT